MNSKQSDALLRLAESWAFALRRLSAEPLRVPRLYEYLRIAPPLLDVLSNLPPSPLVKEAENKLRRACFQVAQEFPDLAMVAHVVHLESNTTCKLVLLPGIPVRTGKRFSLPVLVKWSDDQAIVVVGRRSSTSIPFYKYMDVDPYTIGVFRNKAQAEQAARDNLRSYA